MLIKTYSWSVSLVNFVQLIMLLCVYEEFCWDISKDHNKTIFNGCHLNSFLRRKRGLAALQVGKTRYLRIWLWKSQHGLWNDEVKMTMCTLSFGQVGLQLPSSNGAFNNK